MTTWTAFRLRKNNLEKEKNNEINHFAKEKEIKMKKTKNKLEVTLPSDTEILQTRIFDAPRDLVFKAYTDPDILSKWWGPREYEIIVDHIDIRPGGKWRVIHRDKDGNDYAFNGEYREISPPEKIVNTLEFEPLAGHISVEHTTFEEVEGKTRITTLSKFDNKEDRDGMLQSGMEEGAGESFDRFEEVLTELGKDYL
jgi:uncharacterized protein YndB with AHSA1/START domain